VVVSNTFSGMKLLDRQRAVHLAIKEYMPRIHALTIKAWTMEQYEEKKNTL